MKHETLTNKIKIKPTPNLKTKTKHKLKINECETSPNEFYGIIFAHC